MDVLSESGHVEEAGKQGLFHVELAIHVHWKVCTGRIRNAVARSATRTCTESNGTTQISKEKIQINNTHSHINEYCFRCLFNSTLIFSRVFFCLFVFVCLFFLFLFFSFVQATCDGSEKTSRSPSEQAQLLSSIAQRFYTMKAAQREQNKNEPENEEENGEETQKKKGQNTNQQSNDEEDEKEEDRSSRSTRRRSSRRDDDDDDDSSSPRSTRRKSGNANSRRNNRRRYDEDDDEDEEQPISRRSTTRKSRAEDDEEQVSTESSSSSSSSLFPSRPPSYRPSLSVLSTRLVPLRALITFFSSFDQLPSKFDRALVRLEQFNKKVKRARQDEAEATERKLLQCRSIRQATSQLIGMENEEELQRVIDRADVTRVAELILAAHRQCRSVFDN